jgi:hypothetical protein
VLCVCFSSSACGWRPCLLLALRLAMALALALVQCSSVALTSRCEACVRACCLLPAAWCMVPACMLPAAWCMVLMLGADAGC